MCSDYVSLPFPYIDLVISERWLAFEVLLPKLRTEMFSVPAQVAAVQCLVVIGALMAPRVMGSAEASGQDGQATTISSSCAQV